MAKLAYTFKNDILFKMLFVKYPRLLKMLTAALLDISLESITEFRVKNPEIPPDGLGEKFCRLDISMAVNKQYVTLEIQVYNEGNYPERSLYYWARDYSSALEAGSEYETLPRTVIVSIVDFILFECIDFHSEFQPLEVTRHTPLTDKMSLHYFELPKLPAASDTMSGLRLWLLLLNANTEEDINTLETMEVSYMDTSFVKETIGAYRNITATSEFKELERLRERARHNEASALLHARREAETCERQKWEGVVADKNAAMEQLREALARQTARTAELEARLNEGRR